MSQESDESRPTSVSGERVWSTVWLVRVKRAGFVGRARPSLSVASAPFATVDTLTHPKPVHNKECRWDRFNPEWYFQHNYDAIRNDDRQLLEWIRDEFVERFKLSGDHRHGIDIGPGANLYPALTLAPFCEKITLRDFAQPNVEWLRNEIDKRFHMSWMDFWKVLSERKPYGAIHDPWLHLQRRVQLERGSVFDLPRRAYDIGTMFFVAESITSDQHEFRAAVKGFLASLKPGAPFAAAFMMGSQGYRVDTESYPAVAIDMFDVKSCLADAAYDFDIRVIELHDKDEPLRPGYDGMILATGRRDRGVG